jgi:GT2 family glycosyltransferase
MSPMTDPDLVSIIVPVHNAWHYTAQCLESIREHTPPPYQVVVVDNGSTDGTGDRLREMARAGWPLQVIANEENLGFTSAANQGLRAVDCEFRVLLNNDTIVCPGWMEGMLFVLGLDDRIGIVGPKILWPDREAIMATGGLVFARSGCYLPIGRDAARDDPRFSAPEDRQCIEGSCMLIARRVIEAIGLLDETYSPGYWEDADYCFRARQAGFRCVYSPFAEIRHYAGVTARQPEVLAMLRARGAKEAEFRHRWSRFFEP